jgi:enoyl-CoA hydratase/carnithine racemase/NAD(P)-dependent dehydrogenase (short-subunit alcohol dehydrogenase family)/acyl carrier protein/SAM-dependent methyltransferase
MHSARIQSKLLIRDTDPLVREHRVEDIHILPGVSMLDAVYKTLAAAHCPAETVVLRDILFHEPVVTHEGMDRKLTVTVDLGEHRGEVTISSQGWKGDQALSAEATTHMTCRLERVAALSLEPLPPVDLSGGADLDECYAITRHVGIHHDSFMKCRGRVAELPSGDIVASAGLGSRAAARASDFMLHPVFLDCSTIVPLFHLRGRMESTSLFIPFSIEEFSARPFSGKHQVLVRVRRPETDIQAREIIHHDFEIYDSHGAPLARFKKFAVKRVRSLGNVRRLLSSGVSARLAPAQALPAGDDAPPGGSDALAALIGSLIARHGDVPWDVADTATSFFDLGLDSLALLEISESLEKTLGVRLYPTLLFEHSSVEALGAYLRTAFPAETAALGSPAVPAPAARETAAPAPAATEILVPRWRPVTEENSAPAATRVALLGGAGTAALRGGLADRLGPRVRHAGGADEGAGFIEEFGAALDRGLECDEVWLIGADHDRAFALVQVLSRAGRLQTPLVLRAFTRAAAGVLGETPDEAAGHGVWGLWQTVSREYPNVRVSVLDLDAEHFTRPAETGAIPWLEPLQRLNQPERRLLAWREGQFYERRLFRAHPAAHAGTALRPGGVYLIVGGAGGVGMAFLRHLRRRHGARVAVLGRRPPEAVHGLLAAEGDHGREVLYIQGSVECEADLARAIAEIRARFGTLHGIVHSAMVLDDKRLAEMHDADFARVLRPKVAGVQALARATEGLALDFLLFFSSVQSFVGNVSQGNYAAASTYLDGFAAALRGRRDYPVTVVNWGYWSEVGAVASEVYRHLLERQGVHGLRAEAALAALEQVLDTGWEQAAIVSAEARVLTELGLSDEFVLESLGTEALPAPLPVVLPEAERAAARRVFADSERALQALVSTARRRIVHILRELDATDIDQAVRDGRLAREHRSLVRALQPLLAESTGRSDEGLDATAFEAAFSDRVETHPCLHDFAPLLRACLAAYPDILGGRRAASEVVFPEGRLDLVRTVYERSPISAFYNGLVARAVAAYAASRPQEPLRILEVGAGTGATSIAVLDGLRQAGLACEYWYTDLWDKLVADAYGRLGPDYPEMRFRFLDIGSDPRKQGFHEPFDVVIATNVLHASRDLRGSLRHAKLLLRRGGALVLNESVQVQEYSTYTFGLLPGWWGATDPALRLPNSPLAAAGVWRRLLREEGFAEIRALVPQAADTPALQAQEVFVAVSDGELRLAPRTPPRLSLVSKEELPSALRGQLQPLEPAQLDGMPLSAPRCLRLYEDRRRNLWLFLDNPPANTYTDELLSELCTVVEWLHAHPEAVRGRIVYLSHFGSYFSIGGDRGQIVDFLAAGRHDALRDFAGKARRLLAALATLDALVIAVVAGTAQGGGLETLFATDLQVVGDTVRLGLPEIKSGLIPGMGGLTHLCGQIGLPRTKRLVLCGELVSAREAHDMGLVSHLAEDPYAAALALAGQMAHMDTALHAKRLLGRELEQRLTADIDAWLDYVLNHRQWIDVQRIMDSTTVVAQTAAHAPSTAIP